MPAGSPEEAEAQLGALAPQAVAVPWVPRQVAEALAAAEDQAGAEDPLASPSVAALAR